ncbi:MAG: HutD family protein [Burkholderiaceae bacterium]|nr:HutD family protein [Burkholderiaceae bacterium]
MSWQTISLIDVPPSPWRNGGGVTHELLAWPSAQDWAWRLSVAEVAGDGPFSRFDGVQRWFAVLGGAGVQLQLPEQSHVLTMDSVPLCFDGAESVDCHLLYGATQDFNLMLRRDRAKARMQRLSGVTCFVLGAHQTIAIYAINTKAIVLYEHEKLTIESHSLAWRSLPAGAQLQVSAANALWMEITPCA